MTLHCLKTITPLESCPAFVPAYSFLSNLSPHKVPLSNPANTYGMTLFQLFAER